MATEQTSAASGIQSLDADEHKRTQSRGRTVSDLTSGLQMGRDRYNDMFPDEELEKLKATFKQLDTDDSGFISVQNLKAITEAIDELATITEAQLINMIEEVAMIIGHDVDGKLSFRDFCALHSYERLVKDEEEHKEEVDVSDCEATTSTGEAPFEPWTYSQWMDAAKEAADEAEHAVPATVASRQRCSSFAMLEAVAVSRIARFEKLVQDTAAAESKTTEDVRRQNKFASKLEKFKRLESGPTASAAAESEQAKALKAKLKAFEAAAKQDPLAFKASWKKVHGVAGAWREQTVRAAGGAPPPKRSLAELP